MRCQKLHILDKGPKAGYYEMLAQEENAGFEDLDGLLKKFNQKLKETPISGECNEGGDNPGA